MVKLTDPNYYLPVVHAMEANKILSSGRTKPMIIRGVCEQTGDKGEYVVKFRSAKHMWQGSNLNEILASFIASVMDFNVPAPALINISSGFVETMKGRSENYDAAAQSIGLNFGTTLINGYQELIPGQIISAGIQNKIYELFALDVFLGNPDRRYDKPNFLSNGKELLIYDHELAFDFLLSLFKNSNPWQIRVQDLTGLANNYCYYYFKGKDYDFSNFAARLGVLDKSFWKKAQEIIPHDWQNEHFDAIQVYLNKIIDHKDQFASALNRILV